MRAFGFLPADGKSSILFPHPSDGSKGLQVLQHRQVWPEWVQLWAPTQGPWGQGGFILAPEQHLHRHTALRLWGDTNTAWFGLEVS